MKIINLIENTEGRAGCVAAHGLSFYIETGKHRLISDLGPSATTLENAKNAGVALEEADIVVLSHGHYDHSGGILPFAAVNPRARIYMQRTAAGEYYGDNGAEGMKYIGIDKRILELSQVVYADGDLEIDEELSLFVVKDRICEPPFTNGRILELEDGRYVRDRFRHEQFLVIREKGRRVLISGCAHTGMPNILHAFEQKYGGSPDVVISGFHLMKKTEYTEQERAEIIRTAETLLKYNTVYYTCHCTGIPAYEEMKKIMGDRLAYIHCGEELDLGEKEQ